MSREKQGHSGNPYTDVLAAMQKAVPQLNSWLTGKNAEDFDRITIRQRAPGDWIVIVKAYGDDGGPIVCFGQGFDFVEAFRAANGAVARGGWRPDKPWKPADSN